MKKILSLLIIFAAVTTANAQIFQFGVTADVAFDKESGAKSWDKSNFKADMGWSAGVKAKVSLPIIGLGVDGAIKFAQEDRSYSWFVEGEGGAKNDANVSKKVSYLSIPVNLRYDLKLPAVSEVVIPYVFIGPEFCYSFNGFDLDKFKDGDGKSYFKEQKAQWNLNFGIGVELLQHLEISYVHTVRMTDALDDELKIVKELNSRFSDQTNKIALTYYF